MHLITVLFLLFTFNVKAALEISFTRVLDPSGGKVRSVITCNQKCIAKTANKTKEIKKSLISIFLQDKQKQLKCREKGARYIVRFVNGKTNQKFSFALPTKCQAQLRFFLDWEKRLLGGE